MEDTSGIASSLSSEATNSTATTTIPLTSDPLSFPAQSHVEIYSSSPGHLDVEGPSGERAIQLSELKAMLRQQLEYYFSRENLATDAYLLSQMDSDQYVPISTIAKFNQIRRLTEDINLIVEVLRESAYVQVDEAGEKVRPNQRSFVLILREIPETTPMKELEELFSSENCPKFSRCEFAHNNSWYVLFDSDDDTHKAYRYLREEAKTFNGKPIMARIKARLMTSAPFTHSYKNGVCNPSDTEAYNSQQMTQQQQAHVQYTYANVPNESYNNQQICPPFYPPTMLQAWAPTTPACVDLGTVFSMNGLSPQAAFRPLNNNTNRQNYATRERQVKTYNPQQNYSYTRSDQSSRYFSRGQSSYLQRQQQQQQQQQQTQPSFHNIMNAGGFDYVPYTSGSRSLHSFGMDMNFFTAPNIYFRRLQGHSSLYPNHTSQTRHNPVMLTRNQMGVGAINSQDQSYLSVGSGVLPFTKESVLGVGREVSKQSADSQAKENWGPNQRQRSKRWWKENGSNSSSKNFSETSNGLYNSKSVNGSDIKPESPKFDLETTSFPPLPGCLDTDVLDVDVYESRLSDIVKGTVKPITRDTKTQTSESALTANTQMKDSSTVTIEDVVPADGAFTPPVSPSAKADALASAEQVGLDDKNEDDWGDEPLTIEPVNENTICSNSISNASPTSNMTTAFSSANSATSNVTVVTTVNSCTSTSVVTSTIAVSTESDQPANVPNEIEKQTPLKMPKSKQLEVLPKNKPSDLPSPKNKITDSLSKIKPEAFKDKSNLPMKHKGPTFLNNKQLESSSCKDKASEVVINKTADTVSRNSDAFSAKDKQIQMHHSKSRSFDLSPKLKGNDSDLAVPLPSVNGHNDSESTLSSEDEKPFRKLTYSEVAIRAKERVEKIAQELKEKERQEALVRHHRQQEIVAQNKQASARGPFRDFARRVADQRPGARDWRERKKPARTVSLPSAGQ